MKLDFTSYDKSDIFHAEMKPLIDKLQAIAIFLCFCVRGSVHLHIPFLNG